MDKLLETIDQESDKFIANLEIEADSIELLYFAIGITFMDKYYGFDLEVALLGEEYLKNVTNVREISINEYISIAVGDPHLN